MSLGWSAALLLAIILVTTISLSVLLPPKNGSPATEPSETRLAIRTAIILPLIVDASERYDREFKGRIPECQELLEGRYIDWIAKEGQINNPKFCFGNIEVIWLNQD